MSEKSKREIFMKNGAYKLCSQVDSTKAPSANSLSAKDYLLMFDEQIGYLIAKQGMGTWCQKDFRDLFHDIIPAVNNYERMRKALKELHDAQIPFKREKGKSAFALSAAWHDRRSNAMRAAEEILASTEGL